MYESVLLRRSFRQDGKVKHETLANLSALPEPAIEAVGALAGNPALFSADGLEVADLSSPFLRALSCVAAAAVLRAMSGCAGQGSVGSG